MEKTTNKIENFYQVISHLDLLKIIDTLSTQALNGDKEALEKFKLANKEYKTRMKLMKTAKLKQN